MIGPFSEPTALAFVGLAGGTVIGLSARLGRFCSLGALEDAFHGGSRKRLAMWGVAMGVALLGTYALVMGGALDLSAVFYLTDPFSPALVTAGGLMFGYGMAISGNCGMGALARLGGGDLRAFVIVLVLGISAYVTLSGPLAPLRTALLEATRIEAARGGFAAVAGPWAGAVLGAGLLALGLGNADLRKDAMALFWSAMVGLAVVSGWAGTQWIADNGFAAPAVASHSYSAPVGETILYTMTASGGGLSFAVGSVIGVVLGGFLGSVRLGHFRWEACEDPRELRRQIAGAAAMGAGAVLATGCTVGQGLSALSVLSWSAPISILSIALGAAAGLNHLITGRLFPR